MEASRGFDLFTGPVLLIRAGAGEHILLLNFHHIAADSVIFRELVAF